jgi:signal transduction histidine kinase
VQGMVRLLGKSAGNGNSKFLHRVEVANQQTVRLGRLVDDLLDVSRISLGRLSLQAEQLDLSQLAADIMERYGAQARAARCPLTLDAAPNVIASLDRLRMEQVLANLVTNAIKYGAGKPIEVTVSSSGDVAQLAVRDHGMGIQPADVSRIFGRFERAVPSRHYGGLGLGLYISRQIVEAHGGEIAVTSEPGEGSLFVVTLPRYRDRAIGSQRPSSASGH